MTDLNDEELDPFLCIINLHPVDIFYLGIRIVKAQWLYSYADAADGILSRPSMYSVEELNTREPEKLSKRTCEWSNEPTAEQSRICLDGASEMRQGRVQFRLLTSMYVETSGWIQAVRPFERQKKGNTLVQLE